MKKLTFFVLIFLFTLPSVVVYGGGTQAAPPNAATFTYADANPWLFQRTQEAYVIAEVLFTAGELNAPEDMHLHDNVLYIADTGNRRVVSLDLITREFRVVIEDSLSRPTGIFITQDYEIFIADGDNAVLRFSRDGELLQRITRPTDRIFGEHTSFRPQKVVVDHAGIIYVVSEGTFDGIIQLTDEGEFIGFFGMNNVNLTPLEILQNIILSDVQLARMPRRNPLEFTNAAVDSRGLIRTVTQHGMGHSIRAHNVAGDNILSGFDGTGAFLAEQNLVDIAIGRYGQMYVVTSTGLIYEYTSEGFYVFTFGGRALATERTGVFTLAAAIEVDDNSMIYVLDRARNMVHVYAPTNFAASVHRAIDLHERGFYREGLELWREIRQIAGNLRIVNIFIGRAYFQLGEYDRAAYYFELAIYHHGFSEAFWQMRDDWLVSNLNYVLLSVIGIWFVSFITKKLNKKYKFFPDLKPIFKRLGEIKLIADLVFIMKFIRHPIDSFYYLRNDDRGSSKAAAILIFISYAIFQLSFLGTGFLFRWFHPFGIGYAIFTFSLLFIPVVVLFIGCNYLVSSITDGRGRFKDVFNLTGYAFAPYIFFMPLLIIISHFLTFNEAFFMSFGTIAIYTWVFILIFIGLKEIHDFDISVVWKNLFLTIAFAFLVIVVLFIIYMFWDNLIDMVYTMVLEVGRRVFGD